MATFATLKTELQDRGFDHLGDTRRGTYINDAYHELCELEEWPFLIATSTGTAPLTVSDLREVVMVTDTTNDRILRGVDERTLREWYPDLPDSADPEWYWLDGTTTLRVYPLDTTSSLSVRYIKVPADLTGTDTPVVPTRYHSLIVDLAQVRALSLNRSTDERANLAAALRGEVDRKVEVMREVLMGRRLDFPDLIAQTEHRNY